MTDFAGGFCRGVLVFFNRLNGVISEKEVGREVLGKQAEDRCIFIHRLIDFFCYIIY